MMQKMRTFYLTGFEIFDGFSGPFYYENYNRASMICKVGYSFKRVPATNISSLQSAPLGLKELATAVVLKQYRVILMLTAM